MNIFYLNSDPKECAKAHCNKHVVKMVLETAQILSSVHWLAGTWKEDYYRPTHLKHPCVLWAFNSLDNYKWLCNLGLELCKEYTYRYGKTHKSESLILQLFSEIPKIESKGFTEPPKAMPSEYKKGNTIEAYRNYYKEAKKHILQYNIRNKPIWL